MLHGEDAARPRSPSVYRLTRGAQSNTATRDVYVSVLSDTKTGVYTQGQSQGWHRSLTWTHITRYKHTSPPF
ncbi:hypothetical protein RRG08_037839 [Elysia crispata]|uniref:Uncharacterized protein n=1 Tax=Elysia crispata TaxID=231223 RepID=A0AAE1DGL5_9GAST|nr:hypothetical protein RRG08_037839 [Elysia crispata]